MVVSSSLIRSPSWKILQQPRHRGLDVTRFHIPFGLAQGAELALGIDAVEHYVAGQTACMISRGDG